MTGGGIAENVSPWLELESDPGLFTLLVDDFGVKGVQVEEIYDLSKTLENSIYGFIFLFKWMERRGRRSKAANLDPNSSYVTDPNIVNKMFFAHQIVPNSCATHALLSILLNCKSKKYLDLGELLTKFQRMCDGLTPENKGFAIGNQTKLAEAHNSYARPENQSNAKRNQSNESSSYASSSSMASSSLPSYSSRADMTISGQEIFHFICFVPINGRLYELDGLKPFPVDHGPLNSEYMTNSNLSQTSNWTNKFKHIIRQRLSSFNSGQQNHEIRFNLMALVPDKMVQLNEQIELMKYNYKTIFNLLTEFRNLCLNESDLNVNVKTEPKCHLTKMDAKPVGNELASNVKKENEFELNASSSCSSSESKPNTRQLRSSRTNNNTFPKVEIIQNSAKNEQFEISFILKDSNNNNYNSEDRSKNIVELCKIYCIDSIKYLTSTKQKLDILLQPDPTDPKEKENEIINKIKLQLNGENILKTQIQDVNTETKDESVLFKKIIDLASLKLSQSRLSSEIELEEAKYDEELDKRKKYKTDALRRKHIYDEFIVTYLKILNENGKLAEIIRNNGYITTNNSTKININNSQNSSIFLQTQQSSKKRKK